MITLTLSEPIEAQLSAEYENVKTIFKSIGIKVDSFKKLSDIQLYDEIPLDPRQSVDYFTYLMLCSQFIIRKKSLILVINLGTLLSLFNLDTEDSSAKAEVVLATLSNVNQEEKIKNFSQSSFNLFVTLKSLKLTHMDRNYLCSIVNQDEVGWKVAPPRHQVPNVHSPQFSPRGDDDDDGFNPFPPRYGTAHDGRSVNRTIQSQNRRSGENLDQSRRSGGNLDHNRRSRENLDQNVSRNQNNSRATYVVDQNVRSPRSDRRSEHGSDHDAGHNASNSIGARLARGVERVQGYFNNNRNPSNPDQGNNVRNNGNYRTRRENNDRADGNSVFSDTATDDSTSYRRPRRGQIRSSSPREGGAPVLNVSQISSMEERRRMVRETRDYVNNPDRARAAIRTASEANVQRNAAPIVREPGTNVPRPATPRRDGNGANESSTNTSNTGQTTSREESQEERLRRLETENQELADQNRMLRQAQGNNTVNTQYHSLIQSGNLGVPQPSPVSNLNNHTPISTSTMRHVQSPRMGDNTSPGPPSYADVAGTSQGGACRYPDGATNVVTPQFRVYEDPPAINDFPPLKQNVEPEKEKGLRVRNKSLTDKVLEKSRKDTSNSRNIFHSTDSESDTNLSIQQDPENVELDENLAPFLMMMDDVTKIEEAMTNIAKWMDHSSIAPETSPEGVVTLDTIKLILVRCAGYIKSGSLDYELIDKIMKVCKPLAAMRKIRTEGRITRNRPDGPNSESETMKLFREVGFYTSINK